MDSMFPLCAWNAKRTLQKNVTMCGYSINKLLTVN